MLFPMYMFQGKSSSLTKAIKINLLDSSKYMFSNKVGIRIPKHWYLGRNILIVNVWNGQEWIMMKAVSFIGSLALEISKGYKAGSKCSTFILSFPYCFFFRICVSAPFYWLVVFKLPNPILSVLDMRNGMLCLLF